MTILKEPPLTYPQAAEYLNVTELMIQRAVRRGEIVPHHIGRVSYFTKEELTRWFNSKQGDHPTRAAAKKRKAV